LIAANSSGRNLEPAAQGREAGKFPASREKDISPQLARRTVAKGSVLNRNIVLRNNTLK
jgi:hypothetical protein